MKLVVDTNILIAATLFGGAEARRVVRMCLSGEAVPLVGAALAMEYLDVARRPSLDRYSDLTAPERQEVVEAFLSVAAWRRIHFLWRPNLRDEADNHLIELALAGGAGWIVSRNLKDLRGGELRFEGLRIADPGTFLKAMEAKDGEHDASTS